MPLPNETIFEFYEGTNSLNYDNLDGPNLNLAPSQLLANDIYLQGEIDSLSAAISVPYQGSYDAASNTPDLDSTPIGGILAGFLWDVTVAGTFFTKDVNVGDVIRARVDSPAAEADWVIVEGNLTPAAIKVAYESNADTNAFTDALLTKLNAITVDVSKDVWVEKDGNDGTGTGDKSAPFLTVEAAITYINSQTPASGNPFTIQLGSGVFVENPLSLAQGVSIRGNDTILVAANPALDFITMESNSRVHNCTILGVTGAGKYCVKVSGTAAGFTYIDGCTIGGAPISGGVIASSTVAGLTLVLNLSNVVTFSERGLVGGSNVKLAVATTGFFGAGGTSVGVETTSDAETVLSSVGIDGCNIGAIHGSTGILTAILLTITNSITLDAQQTGTGDVEFRSSSLDAEKTIISDLGGLFGAFYNTAQGENKFTIVDELSVGLPGRGRESVFGEGDSFVNGMLAYTFNPTGAVYTDETVSASSQSGSTYAIPNTAVNSALYFSTGRTDINSADFIKFLSMKFKIATAAVGGEIIAEYWDGGSWAEFNHMSTESSGQYRPYAKDIFQRVGSEQVRFDYRVLDDWAKNDPVSLGTDLYWIRFRVNSVLTTAPIFEQTKIGTNRCEINDDGYIEYYGLSRPIDKLPFDTSTFQAANASPGNSDVYFGDNLGVGRIENAFANGVVDRAGMVLPFAQDLDTSCPIKAKFHFFAESGGGDFDLQLRVSNSKLGDSVYEATAFSPTNAPRQQSYTQTESNPGSNTMFTAEFDVDVSDMLARSDDGADLFWMTIERDGTTDANGDDLYMVQLEVLYTKWTSGGHL